MIPPPEAIKRVFSRTGDIVASSGDYAPITAPTFGGPVHVTGDLTVDGDLLVSGNTITFDTATVTVEDPLIKLARSNGGDVVDIGVYGLYTSGGLKYTGLFRDATDGKWKLFTGLQSDPTTTVDTDGTGYTIATLVANLQGNATTASVLTPGRAINGVTFDGSADITIPNAISGATTTAFTGYLKGDGTYVGQVTLIPGTDLDATVARRAGPQTFTGTHTFTDPSGSPVSLLSFPLADGTTRFISATDMLGDVVRLYFYRPFSSGPGVGLESLDADGNVLASVQLTPDGGRSIFLGVRNPFDGAVKSITIGSDFGPAIQVVGDIVADNLSGTNTGDEDLSGYALLAGDQTWTGENVFTGGLTGNGFVNFESGFQAGAGRVVVQADGTFSIGSSLNVVTTGAVSTGGNSFDTEGGTLNAGDASLASLIILGTSAAPTATPGTSTTQLATTEFVHIDIQNALDGNSWKTAVRAATTVNGTLATAFANGGTVDGVVLVTGDRILLKNQTTGTENGLYTVNASGAPTRTTDANTGAELVSATVYVSAGTTNADTSWVCSNDAITLGVTAITFVQRSGSGLYTFTAPITLTGNVVSLANTAVGAGSYGSASSVATFTVDAQGRLIAAGSTTIAIAVGAVSGLGTLATQSGTFSGTHSGTSSGNNSGDQTTVTGNAGTATALATPRAIGIGGSTGLTATGVNFDGTAAINPALTGTLIVGNGGTGGTTGVGGQQAMNPWTALSDGATVTVAVATSTRSKVTVAGNRTFAVTGDSDGSQFTVEVTQDGTGGRTITWWSGITWMEGSETGTPDATAGAITSYAFRRTASGAYQGWRSRTTGGTFSPGGSTTQIEYNNAGAFGGIAGSSWDGTTLVLPTTLKTKAGTSASNARVGGKLFDHYADAGNTTTGETDLYTDTVPANVLTASGDGVSSFYSMAITGSATATSQFKVYFAGTSRFDSGALSLSSSGNWQCWVELVRTGTTTGRISVSLQTPGAAIATYSAEVDMTSLDWTATNVLKITGQRAGVGAATNDIVAKHGWVRLDPSA